MDDFAHQWRNCGLRVISLHSHRGSPGETSLLPHGARSHWCLWVLLQGSCDFLFPQGAVYGSAPTALLARPDEGYQQRIHGTQGQSWWVVADFEVLTLPGWPDPLQRLGQPAIVHFSDDQRLLHWAQQLPENNGHDQRFFQRPAVDQALALFFAAGFSSEQLHLQSSSMPRWLHDLRQHLGVPKVLHHPDLDLADMARMAGVSRSQLCQAFRQYLDCTPLSWLRRERLTNACRLLRNGDQRPIAAIAAECGYRSPNLFARHFRTLMGCSPRHWRRGVAGQK